MSAYYFNRIELRLQARGLLVKLAAGVFDPVVLAVPVFLIGSYELRLLALLSFNEPQGFLSW
jgi:hypothetical protein